MQFLPPNLLSLFKARDPIPFKPPMKKKKKPLMLTGISEYTNLFENPKEVDYSQFKPIETKSQKKERLKKEKQEKYKLKLEELCKQWKPKENKKNKTVNPYKTLFVARLNYATTEDRLKREFEIYGPIVNIRIVKDNKTGKSKGYAFIEYERERDLKVAYKKGDGKKIDGVRVLVDKERARTDKKFKPAYLGGGLGKTRVGGDEANTKYSGRSPPRIDYYDDFRYSATDDYYGRASRSSYKDDYKYKDYDDYYRDSYRSSKSKDYDRYRDRDSKYRSSSSSSSSSSSKRKSRSKDRYRDRYRK